MIATAMLIKMIGGSIASAWLAWLGSDSLADDVGNDLLGYLVDQGIDVVDGQRASKAFRP